MPQIASYEDVKSARKERQTPTGTAWRTNFITPPEGVKTAPMAFLAEGTAGRVIKPHFHEVDQFQVIVKGGGVLGKHGLVIHAVHFSRAYTPYGPLVAGEEGLGFLTLRPCWDQGAQYLPDAREKLEKVQGRKPWQVTEAPKFEGAADVNVHEFAEIKDKAGLAAYSLKLKPNAKSAAPDPSKTEGQYIIVTKGSLTYQGKEYKSISIGWVKPEDGAFPIEAGPEGVEALVLNFPRTAEAEAKTPVVAKDAKLRVWQCALCAFVYDEAKGMPDDGVPPGTRWEDVPETWICPDCSASKSDFDMSVVG